METLKEKIKRYFGDEDESLIGSMLLWGFSDEEIQQAENDGLIDYLDEDESIVYINLN